MSKITRKAGKPMAFFYRLSFAFFFVFCSLVSTAQVSFDSQEELEEAANTFFNEGAYSKAKPLFSQLLSKDALNANFNYQFGVCVMYTEADPLKPLPYIEGGANSAGVNAEAHYFLGKAYQYNYRFEDAQKAFKKAKDAGFSKDGIDLNRNIEECLNGKALYNPAIDFKPAQNKVVLETEFYRPYDFRK
ncbi:MAG: tetratricopeptide repeat protein, partial [Flavobacteriales bacterium]